LNSYEYFFWIGLGFWIASGCCLGLIGIRNSVWFGPSRSILKELNPFDKKLASVHPFDGTI